MKKNKYYIFLVSIACFFIVSFFTNDALSYDKEDFLRYLINKSSPEIKDEGKKENLLGIGINMIKNNKKEETKNVSATKDYVKIEVEGKESNTNVVDDKAKDVKQNTQMVQNNNIKVEDVTTENPPQTVKLENGQPQILIYHTHSTESYEPENVGNYHSLNKKYSVIAVGERLKEELDKRGYSVIHNVDYHDYPSFNGSYQRSLATVRAVTKKYPSIKVIFDIHRDGVDLKTEEMKKNVRQDHSVTINGEKVAKFAIVVGPESPNRVKVENFANYITSVSNKMYPGLARKVIVKPYGKFNTFLSDNYVLFEIGSNANTIEETEATTKYLAQILDEVLKKMNR